MTHFARLDENNIVLSIHVVSDETPTSNGRLGDNPMHVDGETFCLEFYGPSGRGLSGTFKETSKKALFRKQFAGRGMIYNEDKDKFIEVKPFPSWALDGNDDWRAPVPEPTVLTYPWLDENGVKQEDALYYITWDEVNQRWGARSYPGPLKSWEGASDPHAELRTWTWNTGTSQWDDDGKRYKLVEEDRDLWEEIV